MRICSLFFLFWFVGISSLFGLDAPPIKKIEFLPDDDGFKAFGELIYWKTTTDSFPYAVIYTSETLPMVVGGFTLPNNMTVKAVQFDYAPGFRIGAFYEGFIDLWDMGVSWTQFHQIGTDSFIVPPSQQLNVLWEPTLTPVNLAEATQDQEMTSIDFELGRTWHVTDYFFLRGAFAAELAWLSEHLSINYIGAINDNDYRTNSYVSLFNNFNGAGASLNIKTNYYVGYGFSFCGFGKIALYAATINIQNKQEIDLINQFTNNLEAIYLNQKNSILNMKSNIVIDLGGEWGRQILPMMGLKITLFYELNYWPNQIGLFQLIYDKNTEAVLINQFSDVAFQGIALRGTLNF